MCAACTEKCFRTFAFLQPPVRIAAMRALKVVGAAYSIETGIAEFLEEV